MPNQERTRVCACGQVYKGDANHCDGCERSLQRSLPGVEQRYCRKCMRVSYFAGTLCRSCMHLLEQDGDSALRAWRAEEEQRQQVYLAQQEQRQQVYLAGLEQRRLKRRERRRWLWRRVPVIVAAYMAVLLIVTALR